MTADRFRVKFDPEPTSLWRDVVVGADRTIAEFQATINAAFGLDRGHLWFVGDGEAYWESEVKYRSPQEYEESLGGGPALRTERLENAGEVTIGEMADQLGLERYDRICYCYDYGDEWRFYAILKEVIDDDRSDADPAVVKEKGDAIDQYDTPSGTEPGAAQLLPEALQGELPETAVPLGDLRDLEDRDEVVHVISLLSLETDSGAVCERCMIQLEDAGYVLENMQPGWQVVGFVDGTDKSEAELLGALVQLARDWHADIAELSGAVTGQHVDEDTVEAMHVELEAELERIGYGHL
jgi:hypothetical protein